MNALPTVSAWEEAWNLLSCISKHFFCQNWGYCFVSLSTKENMFLGLFGGPLFRETTECGWAFAGCNLWASCTIPSNIAERGPISDFRFACHPRGRSYLFPLIHLSPRAERAQTPAKPNAKKAPPVYCYDLNSYNLAMSATLQLAASSSVRQCPDPEPIADPTS